MPFLSIPPFSPRNSLPSPSAGGAAALRSPSSSRRVPCLPMDAATANADQWPPPGLLRLVLDPWKGTILDASFDGDKGSRPSHLLGDIVGTPLVDLTEDLSQSDWSRTVAALSLGSPCTNLTLVTKGLPQLGSLQGRSLTLHVQMAKVALDSPRSSRQQEEDRGKDKGKEAGREREREKKAWSTAEGRGRDKEQQRRREQRVVLGTLLPPAAADLLVSAAAEGEEEGMCLLCSATGAGSPGAGTSDQNYGEPEPRERKRQLAGLSPRSPKGWMHGFRSPGRGATGGHAGLASRHREGDQDEEEDEEDEGDEDVEDGEEDLKECDGDRGKSPLGLRSSWGFRSLSRHNRIQQLAGTTAYHIEPPEDEDGIPILSNKSKWGFRSVGRHGALRGEMGVMDSSSANSGQEDGAGSLKGAKGPSATNKNLRKLSVSFSASQPNSPHALSVLGLRSPASQGAVSPASRPKASRPKAPGGGFVEGPPGEVATPGRHEHGRHQRRASALPTLSNLAVRGSEGKEDAEEGWKALREQLASGATGPKDPPKGGLQSEPLKGQSGGGGGGGVGGGGGGGGGEGKGKSCRARRHQRNLSLAIPSTSPAELAKALEGPSSTRDPRRCTPGAEDGQRTPGRKKERKRDKSGAGGRSRDREGPREGGGSGREAGALQSQRSLGSGSGKDGEAEDPGAAEGHSAGEGAGAGAVTGAGAGADAVAQGGALLRTQKSMGSGGSALRSPSGGRPLRPKSPASRALFERRRAARKQWGEEAEGERERDSLPLPTTSPRVWGPLPAKDSKSPGRSDVVLPCGSSMPKAEEVGEKPRGPREGQGQEFSGGGAGGISAPSGQRPVHPGPASRSPKEKSRTKEKNSKPGTRGTGEWHESAALVSQGMPCDTLAADELAYLNVGPGAPLGEKGSGRRQGKDAEEEAGENGDGNKGKVRGKSRGKGKGRSRGKGEGEGEGALHLADGAKWRGLVSKSGPLALPEGQHRGRSAKGDTWRSKSSRSAEDGALQAEREKERGREREREREKELVYLGRMEEWLASSTACVGAGVDPKTINQVAADGAVRGYQEEGKGEGQGRWEGEEDAPICSPIDSPVGFAALQPPQAPHAEAPAPQDPGSVSLGPPNRALQASPLGMHNSQGYAHGAPPPLPLHPTSASMAFSALGDEGVPLVHPGYARGPLQYDPPHAAHPRSGPAAYHSMEDEEDAPLAQPVAPSEDGSNSRSADDAPLCSPMPASELASGHGNGEHAQPRGRGGWRDSEGEGESDADDSDEEEGTRCRQMAEPYPEEEDQGMEECDGDGALLGELVSAPSCHGAASKDLRNREGSASSSSSFDDLSSVDERELLWPPQMHLGYAAGDKEVFLVDATSRSPGAEEDVARHAVGTPAAAPDCTNSAGAVTVGYGYQGCSGAVEPEPALCMPVEDEGDASGRLPHSPTWHNLTSMAGVDPLRQGGEEVPSTSFSSPAEVYHSAGAAPARASLDHPAGVASPLTSHMSGADRYAAPRAGQRRSNGSFDMSNGSAGELHFGEAAGQGCLVFDATGPHGLDMAPHARLQGQDLRTSYPPFHGGPHFGDAFLDELQGMDCSALGTPLGASPFRPVGPTQCMSQGPVIVDGYAFEEPLMDEEERREVAAKMGKTREWVQSIPMEDLEPVLEMDILDEAMAHPRLADPSHPPVAPRASSHAKGGSILSWGRAKRMPSFQVDVSREALDRDRERDKHSFDVSPKPSTPLRQSPQRDLVTRSNTDEGQGHGTGRRLEGFTAHGAPQTVRRVYSHAAGHDRRQKAPTSKTGFLSGLARG